MEINRKIFLIPAILLSYFSIGSLNPSDGSFIDKDFGFVEYGKDFDLGTIEYEAYREGVYYIYVKFNDKEFLSRPKTVLPTYTGIIDLNYIWIPKTSIYAKNNHLEIHVINNTYSTDAFTSLEFDSGLPIYVELSGNSGSYNLPNSYLFIKDGVLRKETYSYSISKPDEEVYLTQRYIDLSSFLVTINTTIAQNEFKSFRTAEMRVYNHYKVFELGETEYDSVKKRYYKVFKLPISYISNDKQLKAKIEFPKHYVSYRNLQMKDNIDNSSLYFESRNFYFPIGFGEEDDKFEIEILYENIGLFKDTLVLRSTFYAGPESFGNCYKGQYCIYFGEAR